MSLLADSIEEHFRDADLEPDDLDAVLTAVRHHFGVTVAATAGNPIILDAPFVRDTYRADRTLTDERKATLDAISDEDITRTLITHLDTYDRFWESADRCAEFTIAELLGGCGECGNPDCDGCDG